MKTLFVHRHAKSDWTTDASSDHDRPLNARGMRDAPFMAELFAKEGVAVDLLLSSTALRAQDTMECYRDALKMESESVRLEKRIYHSDVNTLVRILSELDDTLETVMLFGHNPTLTDLCHHLDSHFRDYLPTCSRVHIELDIDSWKEISMDSGICKEHIHPKVLRG